MIFFMPLFLTLNLFSAPFPTTGSSLYLDAKKNLFLHPLGFKLDLEKTNARIHLQSNEDEKWTIRFPDERQIFTMRYRIFQSDEAYEKSLKLWLREYQKSGLKIVQENIASKRPTSGWIHLEDSEGRQIFQYFAYQGLYWVYFGCAGERADIEILRTRCALLHSRLSFGDELLDASKRTTRKTR